MELFNDVIKEFGSRMSLPYLTVCNGLVDLTIEKVGRFQVEEAADYAWVSLARAWPAHSNNAALTALAACHWNHNHPWVIHAGLKGEEWLVFTAIVPQPDFTTQTLDKLLGYLSRMHDAVEQAA